MKIEFENGYAKGFAVAVPDCFRNALNNGQFSEGDTLYSSRSAYEKVWSEALKDIRYSIKVCVVTGDSIKCSISVPNHDRSKLEAKELIEVPTKSFIDLLRAGVAESSIKIDLFEKGGAELLKMLVEESLSPLERISLEPQAASQTVEIIKAVGELAIFPSLATVLCAWLKNKRSRKLIITLEDKTIFHSEGLSQKEIEALLPKAARVAAVDPEKKERPNQTGDGNSE